MRTLKIPLTVVLLAASQVGATDCGEITRDPGFDLWCGDQLCSWKIDHGQVNQVPTWHAGDDGAELVGDAAIYQLTPVTSDDGACIEFELIADVAAGVDARFQVDVFGDGSIEHEESIPAADWQPLVYRFGVEGRYQGITFWITKRGEGRAVVAQLQARVCDEGQTAGTIITGSPAPDGARCDQPSDCGSGACEMFPGAFAPPATCGTCEIGAACPGAGDVCGLAPPALYTLGASSACVPAASVPLGGACGVNEECTDGTCAFGVCSTCFDQSCGGGETCDVAEVRPLPEERPGNYPVPFVCSPGGGRRAAGEPCHASADCASGACAGPDRMICGDGRACTSNADCPAVDGLDHDVCEKVGVIGGTCQ